MSPACCSSQTNQRCWCTGGPYHLVLGFVCLRTRNLPPLKLFSPVWTASNDPLMPANIGIGSIGSFNPLIQHDTGPRYHILGAIG